LALKELLENGPETLVDMKKTNEEAVKKAKYFYQMCLNESMLKFKK
jgi:hypothetical protein